MRITAWVLAISLACAGSAGAAAGIGAAGIDWASLGDTVLHTVTSLHSLPTPVAPFAFAQDHAGFLWAGGQAGLLRWDGYQFRAYTPSTGRDDGLRNHYVLALHADSAGELWAGTEEGGLARYDAASDRFQPVPLADGNGEADRVWSLDDDGAGGLWVGTNRGVAHLDARHQIVPPAPVAGTPASGVFAVPDRKVEALAQGRDGALWIGGAEGLARIGSDGRAMPIGLPTESGASPEVSHLMQDGAGRIWVGTRYSGAFVVDPATRLVRAVPTPAGLSPQNGGLEIGAIEEVEPGRIWLATFGHGIIDVNEASLSVRAISRDPMLRGSLDTNQVLSLYKDRSGITWIGTAESIDQFVPPVGDIHTLLGNPARPDGVPVNVPAVLARPDGSVWLGSETDGDGVVVLGADGAPRRTLKLPRVTCLASEGAGPVYIGTRGGLFVASPDGDAVSKVELPSQRPHAGVDSLLVSGRVVWVGGGDDDGLWELHPTASGSFQVARHVAAPPLPTASVEGLALTSDGLLAVGTAHGLGLLNRATGAVENIAVEPSGPQGMAAGQIVSFLTDRRGRLWIGTDDSGIAVLLGRDARGRPLFHWITTADGLPNADINRMLADSSGRVWVATDNGLAVIDPDGFAVRALREADGVAIPIYLNYSGDRMANGDLLFGGHGGLTVVRPGHLGSWDYRPPVAISEIHVGGRLVRTRSPEIVVRPEANSLAVEFAALDFSAPEHNLYRYRLDGFDSDYIVTDAGHRVATYTNLPPGKYKLRVQGSNRNGVWSPATTCVVRVLPAWFQTIYARVAGLGLVVLLGWYVVRVRTALLRRRQIYLESLVQQRTSELLSSQQKLTDMAYLDTLTSLPNRRSFNETLQAFLEAATRPAHEFVVILIDLDGFKRVNDTLGHDAGDALLVIAAARLRAALREGDFVARLGGDEFAILLNRVNDHDMVKLVCDRVVNGMTAPIEIKGHAVKIGASVGVAPCTHHERTAEELYKHADEALYAAKRAGKGMWRWYQDATLEDA